MKYAEKKTQPEQGQQVNKHIRLASNVWNVIIAIPENL